MFVRNSPFPTHAPSCTDSLQMDEVLSNLDEVSETGSNQQCERDVCLLREIRPCRPLNTIADAPSDNSAYSIVTQQVFTPMTRGKSALAVRWLWRSRPWRSRVGPVSGSMPCLHAQMLRGCTAVSCSALRTRAEDRASTEPYPEQAELNNSQQHNPSLSIPNENS